MKPEDIEESFGHPVNPKYFSQVNKIVGLTSVLYLDFRQKKL